MSERPNPAPRRAEPRAGTLGDLYRRHADAAFGFAYLLTGKRELAQDLVQEAFIRMMGRFEHLRRREAFEAYLRKTVLNLFLSQRRRKKLESDYVARERATAVVATPLPDVAQREDVWRALLELPARQRAALVLRYYEDLSEQQAAEVLGCSLPALKSLVTRGAEAMRQRIGREL